MLWVAFLCQRSKCEQKCQVVGGQASHAFRFGQSPHNVPVARTCCNEAVHKHRSSVLLELFGPPTPSAVSREKKKKTCTHRRIQLSLAVVGYVAWLALEWLAWLALWPLTRQVGDGHSGHSWLAWQDGALDSLRQRPGLCSLAT